jgi:hypothetical protein
MAREARPGRLIPLSRLILMMSAVALAILPVPRWLIEHAYSNGFYAVIQPLITFSSNVAGVSLLDGLAIGTLTLFVALAVRDLRSNSLVRASVATIVRGAAWSAAFYLAFLVVWGFNYRRERLAERLTFDASAVTPAAALRLAATTVDRLNALHSSAHAEGWLPATTIDPSLAGAFDRVTAKLDSTMRVVVGRPKHSLLDWYFRRAGVSGMTDPFFLETLVAGDLLPFERPAVIAHEWAHLAGIADEGEANAVGWFICLRASAASQYSGWLFMYGEVMRALPPADRPALTSRLAAGPRTDLRAIRDRVAANINPEISAAGWRVYDSYLKANRVEAGTRSYDEVLRLALGLRLFQNY